MSKREGRRLVSGMIVGGAGELSFPTGQDGLFGLQFVEALATSHRKDGAWVRPGLVHTPLGKSWQ